MSMIKKISLMAMMLIPSLVMAHEGHYHHQASFWTGFAHPFTGLDHLLMALSFGVLMWSMTKAWKLIGAWGLVTALVAGFGLGAQGLIPSQFAEYGIIASMFVLAVSLWTKSNLMFPIAAVLLSIFHGSAHGAELAINGHVVAQVFGMISAMALIYGAGLGLGAILQTYLPQGEKWLASVLAVVAIFGLA